MLLLRNRAFLLLTAGQAVLMVGTQISQLAFPLLVLDVTGSPALTGLLVALRTVPALALLLPAGAWLDRWDRKRTMIISDAARALALGAVPIALLSDAPILPLPAFAALVDGVCNTFFSVAEVACLPQVVPDDQLPQALAVDNSAEQIARMVGPTLGGVLYAAGRAIPFAVDGISYAASVISLMFIKVPFQTARTAGAREPLVDG